MKNPAPLRLLRAPAPAPAATGLGLDARALSKSYGARGVLRDVGLHIARQ